MKTEFKKIYCKSLQFDGINKWKEVKIDKS